MNANLTDTQRLVLRYMDAMNAGAVFFDPGQKWLSRSDIRGDAKIAERYYRFRQLDIDKQAKAANSR